MKYAIYFKWNDNQTDSIICDNKFDRDLNIKNMLERHEFKEIEYCKIYKSGEYGKRVTVLKPESIYELGKLLGRKLNCRRF